MKSVTCCAKCSTRSKPRGLQRRPTGTCLATSTSKSSRTYKVRATQAKPPRAVTQFAVDMVNPRLGEKVLDPACGTGGFLACAIEHVRKQDVNTPDDEDRLQTSVYGVEKKPLPHLLCVTNMIVHGIAVPTGVRHDNTLARLLTGTSPCGTGWMWWSPTPPFGGMEEDGIESNFDSQFRTRETADLFLVYLMEILKPGGRAAVVLPDGTLFGEGVKTRIPAACTSAHHRAAAQGRVRPVHPIATPMCCSLKGHHPRDLVLRAPVPGREQVVLEDQAHADFGVRCRKRRGGPTEKNRAGVAGGHDRRRSASVDSTSTSKTPTPPRTPTKTPTCCWPATPPRRPRPRKSGASSSRCSPTRWWAAHDSPRPHRRLRDAGGRQPRRYEASARAGAAAGGAGEAGAQARR